MTSLSLSSRIIRVTTVGPRSADFYGRAGLFLELQLRGEFQ